MALLAQTNSEGQPMLIILCLYVVALWAVFSKFKLVRWGWLSGTVSLLIGGFILATFLALFNYLTPSGRVTVTGRVVEVTPNVTGQIVAIPVKPNVPVKQPTTCCFRSTRRRFSTRSRSCRPRSPAAKQQVEILKSNYEQATANVAGLTAQAAYNKKRLADIETLAADDSQHAIPGAGQAGPVRDGVGATRRGQGRAAERQARAGFRDRRRQHHGRAASGATR